MARADDYESRYRPARADLDSFLVDDLAEEMAGQRAFDLFGVETNTADMICVVAGYERAAEALLRDLVNDARAEGHSWYEIAAALGVSRQAAQKRFSTRPKRSGAGSASSPQPGTPDDGEGWDPQLQAELAAMLDRLRRRPGVGGEVR